ncbi:MAG: hypothetical protein WCL44_11680, partial [bacterium]
MRMRALRASAVELLKSAALWCSLRGMLDIRTIREREKEVRHALEIRGMAADIDGILALDHRRRELLVEVEALKGTR